MPAKMKQMKHWMALAAIAIALTACGGGNGAAVVPPAPPTSPPGGGVPLPEAPEVVAVHGVAAFRAGPLRVGAVLPQDAYTWPLPPVAANRTVVFSEDDNGMYINGKKFSMSSPPMFVVRVGTVERWQIVNVSEEVHDFHMHQTHFFVEQVDGATVAHPHWADSVVVPHRIPGKNGSWTPGYLTILIDFRDPVIRGEFMFHCQILDHEDSGMMAKIAAI